MASSTPLPTLPEPLTEFTLFPELPKELQIKIGKKTLEPRIIDIMWSIRKQAYVTDATFPAAVHACHESRVEALKGYSLLSTVIELHGTDFRVVLHRSSPSISIEKQFVVEGGRPFVAENQFQNTIFRTYINYNTDTICVARRHFDLFEKTAAADQDGRLSTCYGERANNLGQSAVLGSHEGK
jgi:hypothetical protein